MRASSPCLVVLSRFGVWNSAIASICLLGAAASLAWSTTSQALPEAVLRPVCALALLGTTACGVSLVRVRPVELRWDGQAWFLTFPLPAMGEPCRGNVTASIDVGTWMLLRFTPDGSGSGSGARLFPGLSVVWLPVQRRGVENQWHALRCAVFAPRPRSREPGPENRA